MKNIAKLPQFMPGQVIDLSYKYKGLPNRLLVKTVFINEQSNGWMYDVYLENIGEYTTLEEKFIQDNMTHKHMEVYRCAEIIKLYHNGWRFCGNFTEKSVNDIAAKIALNTHIRNVITRPALNGYGCLDNGKRGIWVKYYNIINDDGTINGTSADDKDTIIIK